MFLFVFKKKPKKDEVSKEEKSKDEQNKQPPIKQLSRPLHSYQQQPTTQNQQQEKPIEKDDSQS